MEPRRLRTYLRTRRLEHGFSQIEIGELIGITADTLCDYEREKTVVSARMLIAGEIIFGEHASSLFPHFYKTVQDEIGGRALAIYERLEGATDPASKKKLGLLGGLPARTHSFDFL